MDAFFASVEQRDNPLLRGKPVAVGHEGPRGVVATASYEARRFGVRSAMPAVRARRLCPQLIFVDGRMEVYKAVSRQVHEIFQEYTDLIEPISIDEAYLDVTVNKPGIELAVEIAREIKQKIRDRLGLIASAGVSYNKFLAKVASDYRKPDGLCTIHPSQARQFIDAMKIEDFWGVGSVTAEKMHKLGIHTGADLLQWPLDSLTRQFGKAGEVFYNFARGIDERPVVVEHERKSIGCEYTFETDLTTLDEIKAALTELAEDLEGRLMRKQFRGLTLTLKVRYNDFSQVTRAYTSVRPIFTIAEILSAANHILKSFILGVLPIRLLGLSVSHPEGELPEGRQLYIDFPELRESE
ncbi:MAG: DNA polymerase IV [Candidatus Amulumruptor caecigallinarius]|nr:DNA polymerase IV [Candidatus Amulumruptor caecigallinarius]MCM1396177.1 DNA polymerase IV [Candidatus Amulumruptor caecigallinarius]MCM1453823.1 DNA polymerase IV [bacterium]